MAAGLLLSITASLHLDHRANTNQLLLSVQSNNTGQDTCQPYGCEQQSFTRTPPAHVLLRYVTQSMRWLISCYSTCSAVAAVIQRLTSCWRGGEAASRKNTVKKKNNTNKKKNLHHCQLCTQSAVDTGCAASSHTLAHGHSCVVNLPQSASDRYQLCSELWL